MDFAEGAMTKEKRKMENEMVERELSSLFEITFRLEDELNALVRRED
jgi:hypothetical protein